MLCQQCKKHTATFHYTSNENGNVSELHLCRECAEKNGYLDNVASAFTPFGFMDDFFHDEDSMFTGLLGEIMGEPYQTGLIRESATCPKCGMRLNEFLKIGKAGCDKCYTTFRNALAPTLQKLHGNAKHVGKVPSGMKREPTKEEKIAELQKQLNAAVEKQEYEQAAKLRDEIKALEK